MLLTIKDLSKQLQVQPSTLYAWVAEGKIPSLKINGLIRFLPEAIDRWVESLAVACANPLPKHLGGQNPRDLDAVIARVKREVYTFPRGKPDQDRATRKEGNDGSV